MEHRISVYLPFADEKGDRICLFGFSTGAYIARAIAGMVFDVSCSRPYIVRLDILRRRFIKDWFAGKRTARNGTYGIRNLQGRQCGLCLGFREFISSPR